MKIKGNKDAIKKGFHAVESVISGTNINPMLQNVKIVAKGKTLELSTTDLEVSVSYTVGSVEVIKPGKMVGPENKIASIVKEWSEDNIEITEEDRKCIIEGVNSYFKILCLDPEEFPVIPKFVKEEYIEIDKDILIEMIKKTSFIIHFLSSSVISMLSSDHSFTIDAILFSGPTILPGLITSTTPTV